jgi:hypothetical protein
MLEGFSVTDFLVSKLHEEEISENQLPKIKVPKYLGSYYRLNLSEIFILMQEMEAGEFKVFLFLSLKAWGWDGKLQKSGDGSVQASASYIAKGTNLSEASVNKYVISLLNKNYIIKTSICYKNGNTYQISQLLWVPKSQAPQNLGTLNSETNIEKIDVDEEYIFKDESQVPKSEVSEDQTPESDWTLPSKEYIEKRKELAKRLVLGI